MYEHDAGFVVVVVDVEEEEEDLTVVDEVEIVDPEDVVDTILVRGVVDVAG